MILSIVTINYNNAEGLKKTLASVTAQTVIEFEHVVVDGASTDGSADIIREYAEKAAYPVCWVSEPDKGIYNAMNKGLRMASGEYIEILNSGDTFATIESTAKMQEALKQAQFPPILYGNMLKDYGNGKLVRDDCGGTSLRPDSFLYFYKGTLNHDCAYIRRSLFEKYGYYNEEMRICSDWEWYVKAIAIGGEKTVYANADVTIFDMEGISESGGKNRDVIIKERRGYLEQVLPKSVLNDYDNYQFPIEQYRRLKKHHLWGVASFMERVLFKLEKWGVIK